MDVNKVLAGEFVVAVGFVSWAAIKAGWAPWPPSVIYTGVAFGILGGVSVISPELAATLGAGFLLAALIRILSQDKTYRGGVPVNDRNELVGWGILGWKK